MLEERTKTLLLHKCYCGGMADTLDLKSNAIISVPVQVWSVAPKDIVMSYYRHEVLF